MTRGRGEASLPAGGPARHIPVLLAESMEAHFEEAKARVRRLRAEISVSVAGGARE
jgi:hypothetical protein